MIKNFVIAIGLAFAAITSLPAHAAMEESEVLSFVQSLVNDTLSVIMTGKEENADQEAIMDNPKLRKVLRTGFAVPQIGKSVVGKTPWKAASKEQRQRFLGEFENYVMRTYISRLKDFNGDISYGQTEMRKRDALVHSMVSLPDLAEPINVQFQVVKSPVGLKIIDLKFEGTSMRNTFLGEFRAVLKKHKGDLDKLTEELAGKADKPAS